MIKKTIFTSLMLIAVSGFVFGQNTSLKFKKDAQKFGKVDEGTKIELEYAFVNEGTKPVIFNDFKVNCTCTKVTYPEIPVKPNESGIVYVSFDTHGKIGYQERKIELKTNEGLEVITFKGVVKATDETKETHKHTH